MGMYDYVKVDVNFLPINDELKKILTGQDFQTKSFDQEMTTYTIKKDGVYKLEFEWEEVQKAERPYPDAKDDDLMSLAGCMRHVNEREVKVERKEPFQFYTNTDNGWFEFEYQFISDYYIIKNISIQARKDNAERNKAIKEILDKMEI